LRLRPKIRPKPGGYFVFRTKVSGEWPTKPFCGQRKIRAKFSTMLLKP